MDILAISTVELDKFDEYLEILNKWTIILNWWRTNSRLFNKWLNDNNINNIDYRWWYNPESEFVDYYYFYKKNEGKSDYDYLVKALVEKNL